MLVKITYQPRAGRCHSHGQERKPVDDLRADEVQIFEDAINRKSRISRLSAHIPRCFRSIRAGRAVG